MLLPLAYGLTGHVNNLYNTTFWALVNQGGADATSATEALKVREADMASKCPCVFDC